MSKAYKVAKFFDNIINKIISLFFIIAIIFCLYALFDIFTVYNGASSSGKIAILKPTVEEPIENKIDRLNNINPDICGWITIDGTNIDYPILIGEDNSKYLTRDVYGNYAVYGSIFLDYRNSREWLDKYSVVFGHNMKNDVMFSDIKKFAEQEFFDTHTTGMIYTKNGIFELQIFAFLETDAFDSNVYGIKSSNEKSIFDKVEYIKENAIHYREVEFLEEDKIIALSTCKNNVTDGRQILFVKISNKVN